MMIVIGLVSQSSLDLEIGRVWWMCIPAFSGNVCDMVFHNQLMSRNNSV